MWKGTAPGPFHSAPNVFSCSLWEALLLPLHHHKLSPLQLVQSKEKDCSGMSNNPDSLVAQAWERESVGRKAPEADCWEIIPLGVRRDLEKGTNMRKE